MKLIKLSLFLILSFQVISAYAFSDNAKEYAQACFDDVNQDIKTGYPPEYHDSCNALLNSDDPSDIGVYGSVMLKIGGGAMYSAINGYLGCIKAGVIKSNNIPGCYIGLAKIYATFSNENLTVDQIGSSPNSNLASAVAFLQNTPSMSAENEKIFQSERVKWTPRSRQ